MTDQHNTAPAVWDPTARGGAGGWVRGAQAQPAAGQQQPPAGPQPPAGAQPPAVPDAEATQKLPPVQGPPPGARPYPGSPGAPPAPPAAPAAPAANPGFPAHAAGHGFDQAPTRAVPPVRPPGPPAQPAYSGFGQYPAPRPDQAPPGHDARGFDGPGYGGPGYGAPGYGAPGYGAPDFATYENHENHRDPDEDRGGSRRAPLLIGFALLFVLALGGGILWAVQGDDSGTADQAAPVPTAATTSDGAPQPAPAPSGASGTPGTGAEASPSASPSPSASASGSSAGPNAKAQAKALDELLARGENAKAPIGNAVAKVNSCPSKTDIESSAQVFDTGAKERDQLLAQLAQLSVAEVPGGAEAVQSLRSAWQLSAEIDRAYAAWARSVADKGCSGTAPNTADKKRADELNPQATSAKKDFVAKWNVVAASYGLTARTQDRI